MCNIEYPTIVLYPASKNGPKRQFYVMKQNLGRSAINIANWMLKRVKWVFSTKWVNTKIKNLKIISNFLITIRMML